MDYQLPPASPDIPLPHQPQPLLAEPKPPRDYKRLFTLAYVVILVAVVIGITAIFIQRYITNKPEYILGQAFGSLSDDRGFAADLALKTKIKDETFETKSDVLLFTDVADRNRHELDMGLGAAASRVGLTVRTLEDGSSYGRITDAANLAELRNSYQPGARKAYDDPEIQQFFERLEGQWYALTRPSSQYQRYKGQAEVNKVAQAPSNQDITKLAQVYKQHPFATIEQRQPDTSIDGQQQLHLLLGVDMEEFRQFVSSAKQANIAPAWLTDYVVQQLDHHWPVGSAKVEVWIGRDDREFTKASIALGSGSLGIDFKPERLRGRTAVDRPTFVRDFKASADDTTYMLSILDVKYR